MQKILFENFQEMKMWQGEIYNLQNVKDLKLSNDFRVENEMKNFMDKIAII